MEIEQNRSVRDLVGAVGGRAAVARACGRSAKTVDHWMLTDEIPAAFFWVMCDMAKARKISPPDTGLFGFFDAPREAEAGAQRVGPFCHAE